MKKILKIVLALALAFSGIVVGQVNNVYASNENISAYPHVQSYQTTTGTFFLARESRIFIVENEKTIDNQALLDDVELLSSQLGTLLDKSPNIVIGDKANVLENDIVIQLEELEELASHNQSYRIDIDDHITITAKDNIGIFYGVQTLIQLLKINDYTLLQGTILDWPDTNERSMHLDLARKYFSIDWIKDLIEEMSYLKMNSLQIHFSEHEGYRLESDVLNNVEGFNYPSQYYTKEQMAEIVQYANKHHIDVIPSLDSPGHMRYVLNYLPNEYRLSSVSNLASDGAASGTFNIFNEEAKDFLKSLFTEYAEFFSELGCTKMNIGGDEFLNNFSLLTEEQYSGVMNYFNEITAILKEYGMTPRAWNDGLMFTVYDKDSYHLDPSIEICYWSGGDNCATIADFVENGNKVLNFADVYMYYVLAQWWDQYANASAEKIYNEWSTGRCGDARKDGEIIPQRYEEPYPDFLIGSSFALWCDQANYKTEDEVREQIKDRMRAMALKAWNTTEQMSEYSEVKEAFDKAGRAPAYDDNLPEPGQVINDEQSSAIVIKYRDSDGNSIAKNDVLYGLTGKTYTITPQPLYGYSYVEASDELTGTFDGQKEIVLTYLLSSDKTSLEESIKNKANQNDYVLQTYQVYNQAYENAVKVYTNEKATQVEVDEAYQTLLDGYNQLVPVTKQELYNLVNCAIQEQGNYSPNSFTRYQNAIATGSALLTTDTTDDVIQTAIQNIHEARNQLALSAFIVASTDVPTYQNYGISNTIDGNRGTKFWGQSTQNPGQYFLYTFRESIALNQIVIATGYDSNGVNENADYIRGADVLVSNDGTSWQNVGKLSGEHELVIDVNNVEAKYVKIEITESSANWPQLNEVSFTYDIIGRDLQEIIDEAKKIDSSLYTSESYAYLNTAISNAENLGVDASYDQKALAIYNIDQAIKYLQTLPEGSNDSVVSFEIEHPWIVQTGTVEMVENTEATNGNQYALTSKSATFNLEMMGDTISIYGQKGPENGMMKVTIYQGDNVISSEEVSTASETATQAMLYQKALDAGEYRVVISNNSSNNVVVDYVEIENGTIFKHDPISIDTNKDKLQIAVDLASQVTQEHLDKLVPIVVEEFKNALTEAKEILASSTVTQEQVDASFDRLSSIMQRLEFYKGDKTLLQEFINRYTTNLDETKYTPETWAIFIAELNEANVVLDDVNALQYEVDQAYDELVRAYVNLRLIPDKSLLEELINQAKKLNGSNYTENTWNALITALNNGITTYDNVGATQAEIDSAVNALAKALTALQPKVSVNTPINSGDTTTSVKTGDNSLTGMFATMALLSLAGYSLLRKKES